MGGVILMLTNKQKSISYSATSVIADTVVLYMNGSYNSESGDMTFNQAIRNKKLYLEYKDDVDKDFEDWKNEIVKDITE